MLGSAGMMELQPWISFNVQWCISKETYPHPLCQPSLFSVLTQNSRTQSHVIALSEERHDIHEIHDEMASEKNVLAGKTGNDFELGQISSREEGDTSVITIDARPGHRLSRIPTPTNEATNHDDDVWCWNKNWYLGGNEDSSQGCWAGRYCSGVHCSSVSDFFHTPCFGAPTRQRLLVSPHVHR